MDLVWLNLGCSDDIKPDYINVDICEFTPEQKAKGICVNADLTKPWPWIDSTVHAILAHDIIEHLPDKIFTMNEMWRVLKHGALLSIIVPSTDGTGAFQDPTHVSYWNERSFLYYEKGSPYRERFCKAYGIKAAFKILGIVKTDTPDGTKITTLMETVKNADQHTVPME